MTYSERTMRLMDAVLRGDSAADFTVDGGWPEPPAEDMPTFGETCCGNCPGATCYVDQMTGERS